MTPIEPKCPMCSGKGTRYLTDYDGHGGNYGKCPDCGGTGLRSLDDLISEDPYRHGDKVRSAAAVLASRSADSTREELIGIARSVLNMGRLAGINARIGDNDPVADLKGQLDTAHADSDKEAARYLEEKQARELDDAQLAALKREVAHKKPVHHRAWPLHDSMGTIDLGKAFPPDPKRNEWSQHYDDRSMKDPAR